MSRVCLVVAVSATAFGGPAEDAILAAMRLSEQPNYAWESSVTDDARSYIVAGKTVRDHYSAVTLPMIDDIADRLGRECDTQIEAIFRGPERFVIRVGDRWKTVKELPRPREREEAHYIVIPSRAGFPMDPLAPELDDPWFPMIVSVPAPRDDEGGKPFSNARLALSHPHDELALIVSSCPEIIVQDGVACGVIADVGARLLLAPDNDKGPCPLLAAGRFKFWVSDGIVTRYQLWLEGVVKVGRKKILVRQMSDTRIKEVGSTAVAVPDEARLKLAD